MKSTVSRMAAVALAMWLGLAAGVANAGVPTFSGWDGDASAGYNANFWNTGVLGSFVDLFTFEIPADSSGAGDANVVSLTSRNITNVQLTAFTLFDSLSGVFSTGVIDSTGTEATLSFSGGKVPGSYTLTVAGYKVNTALSGSYSGNIAISPVPEPETYAMLFAGLGLIGFSARRRKSD